MSNTDHRLLPRLLIAVCVAAALSGSVAAEARTWRVEKDGSGDFTIIQDAIDAAAEGDSILIGPGRFDTFRADRTLLDGYEAAAIAWIKTPGLTLIGAGATETIIGPAVETFEVDGLQTGGLLVDAGAESVIQHMGFERVLFPITVYAQSTLEDCRMYKETHINSYGMYVGYCSGVEVRRCEFVGPNGFRTISGASSVLIEDCTFENPTFDGDAIDLSSGAQDCIVRRCSIASGGAGAMQSNGTVLVEDTVVGGGWSTSVNIGGGHAVYRRCSIGGARNTLSVSIGLLEMHDSEIGGGANSTVSTTAQLLIRNSHILNGGGLTVSGRTRVAGEYIDLRYNWWGTADTTQIADWIRDDHSRVLWQPIADAPVPAESSSVGQLKSQYSPR